MERALALLAEVGVVEQLTLSELARRTSLAPSTALRLLRTLEATGFIEKHGNTYQPGTRLVQLGARALARQSLVSQVRPSLQRIVERTGESTYFVIRGAGNTAVYVAMVEGTHAIRHTSWVGRAIELDDLAVEQALMGTVAPGGYVAQRDRDAPDVTAIAAPIRWTGGRRRRTEPARPHLSNGRTDHAQLRRHRRGGGRRDRCASRRQGGLVIRFESVTKRYPDGTVAVDELSFEAPSGKITVLVGPSGCGKTTSLRMINRMIDATSGRIMLDDTDTAKIDPAQLRRGIGYVIQHAGLFPHRTVVDNVATVPMLLGEDKKKARRRAMELLERVGLDPKFAKRYPAQLSGGQQQRVGVARALAADPPVMLMDEPFSAVDPVVREQLQNEFLRLQSELGKTIVFVTHDIDEAIKLGDLVAVMRVGGKLAQFATPAELLSRPADAFVAGFVGRDRGYRALGFAHAGTPGTDQGRDRAARRTAEARQGSRDRRLDARRRRRRRAAGLARRARGCPTRRSAATSSPSCSTSAARWPARTARCASCSTPRCPRRAGAAWSSSRTAGSPARSRRPRCCSASSRAPKASAARPSARLPP